MYCFSLHLLLFELTILCNYQCWPHFFFKIIFILWPKTSCAGTQIIEIKIISHPILKLILIPFSFMNYSQLKYAMDGFCSESWTSTLLSVLVHNLMALCIDASFSFFMPSIFNYWRFDVDVFLSFFIYKRIICLYWNYNGFKYKIVKSQEGYKLILQI